MRDEMTTKERWDALICGEQLDRVPCLQFILGHTAIIGGQPLAKIYDNAELSFKCQRQAQELYGYDGLVLYGYATAGGWEFGGDIEFPYKKYSGAPMVTRNPVQTEEDALKLEVPEDITKAGAVPIALEFSRLQEKHGMPITLQVGSPLTWAGSVIGEERMMMWMIKKPELVHRVLDKVTEFCLKIGDYWVREFGPERLMAFDLCIETNKLYSPKQFETFALPYLKRIHDKLSDAEVGIFFSHICGEHNKNLKYWETLRYGKRGMISIGREVSIARAREAFPECIITGNVDPATIQEGTPEEVLDLCAKAVQEGKDHPGGFALMSGCEIPPAAAPVNVYQMVKACREYGQY